MGGRDRKGSKLEWSLNSGRIDTFLQNLTSLNSGANLTLKENYVSNAYLS